MQISAPPRAPDPWSSDAPEQWRCPRCGQLDPGERRCTTCDAELVQLVRRTRPVSLTLLNLFVIMLGRGGIAAALFISLLLSGELPELNAALLYIGISELCFFPLAGLMLLRRPAIWFATLTVAILDLFSLLLLLYLNLLSLLLVAALFVVDLLIIGMLLLVWDECKHEWRRIDLPALADWPKTASSAYNQGVNYSEQKFWYLAARMWQRAVMMHALEFRYRRALGLAYLQLKLRDYALIELQAALQLNPQDSQTAALLRMVQGKE